ncbi:MAG TPA: hypothetical protein VGK80_01755 [Rhodanobacteraceae bacterium]
MSENPQPSPLHAEPVTGNAVLRVGLLLDDPSVPAWIARIVDEIHGDGFVKIASVIINAGGAGESGIPSNRLLYAAYVRNEIRRRRNARSAFLERDLTEALPDADWLQITPLRARDKLCLSAVDLDKIRNQQLDVLLRFGFQDELCSELISAARHGIWMYAHGNRPEDPGASSIFRVIQRREPVTSGELWQLPPNAEAPRLLYRSFGSTHPHSLEIGQQAVCWKASTFTMRCLRRLARTGEVSFEPSQSPDRPPRIGNFEMARFLARNIAYKGRALIRNRATVEHWSVLWRQGRPLDPGAPVFEGARQLPCPRGHFYADPFLFRHEGEDWLFVEDYDYAKGLADIAAIPWSAQGPAGPARSALRLDEHLSYPHVFGWKNEVYMVPEIGASGGPVRLFKARRFPDDWEFVCDLLSGCCAVDATLHEHRDRWYLFANIDEAGGGENDELFLFHADTPLGPFRPHPQNPIVSDVRHARPAGRIFTHSGRLIRPSQDCAGGYGRAIVFNEILALDPEHYRERCIGRLAPSSGNARCGYHTYASLGDLEIVDFKQPRLRPLIGA